MANWHEEMNGVQHKSTATEPQGSRFYVGDNVYETSPYGPDDMAALEKLEIEPTGSDFAKAYAGVPYKFDVGDKVVHKTTGSKGTVRANRRLGGQALYAVEHSSNHAIHLEHELKSV